MSTPKNIAVVGGGIAGLAAARVLRECGGDVTVFDKGRGPGGRASTRRTEHGKFDHGAQYFTVRDAGFAELVNAWRRAGVVSPWQGRFGAIRGGVFVPSKPKERLVGMPGMNAVVRAMGEGIDIRYGTRVDRLEADGSGWSLGAEGGESIGQYDAVVLAVPSVQAAALLRGSAPNLTSVAESAEMTPCWTLMLAFDGRIDTAFEAARIEHDADQAEGPLAWIAKDNSKPGREPGTGDRWVLQAGPEWSSREIERDPLWVRDVMLDAFSVLAGRLPLVLYAQAHRWRYAAVARPAGRACLTNDAASLSVCGDWLLDARIEAAFVSGIAAGKALAICG